MTEVGGLCSRVAPEEIRHRLSPVTALLATPYVLTPTKSGGVSRLFAETADVTFERKMNIFGSINFSSTQHCAYSQQQGDRIIVNKNFFATRLMMCCGPVVLAGDHDHKLV